MIHPLAIVAPEAHIGENVTIDPFVNISGNVEIGDGTHVYSGAVIMDGARIGRNCNIFPGAVVGAIPQDLKFRGEETLAIVGDNTTLRECATVNRGTASRGFTKVGSNCLIMAYTHIAHDCIVGDNVIIANATQVAGEVEIDDYAVVGGGTMIHQFCRLGKHVMIQGGALINKDIPPFVKAAREPIAYTGVNTVGLHRRGFTEAQINGIMDVYRELYMCRLNVTDAVKQIEMDIPENPERDLILQFIRESKRGIIRGYL